MKAKHRSSIGAWVSSAPLWFFLTHMQAQNSRVKSSYTNPKSENLPSVCELELVTGETRFIAVSSIQNISMRALLITD